MFIIKQSVIFFLDWGYIWNPCQALPFQHMIEGLADDNRLTQLKRIEYSSCSFKVSEITGVLSIASAGTICP